MNRFLACTSVVALCAAFAVPTARADDAQATKPAASTAATLAGEIQHAKNQRASGDLDGAAKTLQQLMLVASDNPEVLGEYGKVLVQQGHAKDAIVFLSHATQLNGSDWTLYSALGVAYDQNDDHADARKAYDRALAIKPGELSVLNNYAVSRMLTGDYAGAVQSLTQLEKADGANSKVAANLAKAEELLAAHPAKQPAAVAQAQPAKPQQQPSSKPASPVAVASLPAPAAQKAGVVMQKVPSDPLAGPVRKATAAPRALTSTPADKPTLSAEAAKLHVTPSGIVMEKVPVDPKAGPVKTAAAPKPDARDKRPVEDAKASSATLSLRTASD